VANSDHASNPESFDVRPSGTSRTRTATRVRIAVERGEPLEADPGDASLQDVEPATPDQLEQRVIMLQQLEKQRAELREGDALPDADKTIGEPVEVELDLLGAGDEQESGPQP
jgi:hypothetical protein